MVMSADPPALAIDNELREAIAAAPTEHNVLTVAYVGGDGWPHVSKRASVVVLDDQTVGLWARKAGEGLAVEITQNPRVTLFYIDFATRGVMYTLYGRALVSDAVELADRIWGDMPALEREQDPERRGVAVIIELDTIVAVGRRPERNFTLRR